MHKKYKIALLFAGNHAIKNILPAIEKCNNIEISGIYFRNPKKYKVNNYRVYERVVDALEDKNVDIVYISSPNSLHFKHSYEALSCGKHVICEKPMFTTYDQYTTLLNYSKKVNKKIFEAFMFQHHHQFDKLKDVIENYNVGQIKTLHFKFGYPHRDEKDIRYDKDLGGGSYYDTACYLSKISSLLINEKPEKIFAYKTFCDKYEVDIGGNCIIKYDNDVTCIWDWGMGRSYSNSALIWSENYNIKVDMVFSKRSDLETSIILKPSMGNDIIVKINPMDHFSYMFNNFTIAIENHDKYESYLSEMEMHQNLYFKVLNSMKKETV